MDSERGIEIMVNNRLLQAVRDSESGMDEVVTGLPSGFYAGQSVKFEL